MYLATPFSLSVLLIAGNGVTGHYITAKGRDCDAAAIPMADWKALNKTVGGRLHTAQPLAEPCYPAYRNSFGKFAVHDKAACPTTEANYLNSSFHANQLGGYLNVCIVLPDCHLKLQANQHRQTGQRAKPPVRGAV